MIRERLNGFKIKYAGWGWSEKSVFDDLTDKRSSGTLFYEIGPDVSVDPAFKVNIQNSFWPPSKSGPGGCLQKAP